MLTIHCPGCHARLTVPANAGGRAARCPKCRVKFRVPDPRTMLDETVTAWLDLDHLNDIRDECEKLDETLDSVEQHKVAEPSSPAPPAAAAKRNDRPAAPSATSEETRGTSRPADAGRSEDKTEDSTKAAPRRGGSFLVGRPTARPATEKPAEGDVPADELGSAEVRRLYVKEVGSFGVRMAFSSKLLNLPAFRASLPMRCILTGESQPGELIARPLPWVDKATGHFTNPGELEARYEFNVRHHMTPRQVVKQMHTLLELPAPFNAPMPYYVCRRIRSKTGTIHCETVANASGVQCEVVLPDIRYALEWLGRINGVCGEDYEQLEQQAVKFEAEAWQAIPETVRNRLAVWFDFQGDESFLGYFNDSDFSRSDAGLAGLVLTDQRLVFTKYHAHGTLSLNANGRLIGEHDGTFVRISYVNGGRRKLVCLRPEDADDLARTLQEMDVPMQLTIQSADEPADAATS